jgi:hypothetical protein
MARPRSWLSSMPPGEALDWLEGEPGWMKAAVDVGQCQSLVRSNTLRVDPPRSAGIGKAVPFRMVWTFSSSTVHESRGHPGC